MTRIKNKCALCSKVDILQKYDFTSKQIQTSFFSINKNHFVEDVVQNMDLCIICAQKIQLSASIKKDYDEMCNRNNRQSNIKCFFCEQRSNLLDLDDNPNEVHNKIEIFLNAVIIRLEWKHLKACLRCLFNLDIWCEIRNTLFELMNIPTNSIEEESKNNSRAVSQQRSPRKVLTKLNLQKPVTKPQYKACPKRKQRKTPPTWNNYLHQRLNKFHTVNKLLDNKTLSVITCAEADIMDQKDKLFNKVPFVEICLSNQINNDANLKEDDKVLVSDTEDIIETKTQTRKRKLNMSLRKEAQQASPVRTSARLKENTITISSSDDEDVSYLCNICDKSFTVKCEYIVHNFKHDNFENLVVNLLRHKLPSKLNITEIIPPNGEEEQSSSPEKISKSLSKWIVKNEYKESSKEFDSTGEDSKDKHSSSDDESEKEDQTKRNKNTTKHKKLEQEKTEKSKNRNNENDQNTNNMETNEDVSESEPIKDQDDDHESDTAEKSVNIDKEKVEDEKDTEDDKEEEDEKDAEEDKEEDEESVKVGRKTKEDEKDTDKGEKKTEDEKEAKEDETDSEDDKEAEKNVAVAENNEKEKKREKETENREKQTEKREKQTEKREKESKDKKVDDKLSDDEVLSLSDEDEKLESEPEEEAHKETEEKREKETEKREKQTEKREKQTEKREKQTKKHKKESKDKKADDKLSDDEVLLLSDEDEKLDSESEEEAHKETEEKREKQTEKREKQTEKRKKQTKKRKKESKDKKVDDKLSDDEVLSLSDEDEKLESEPKEETHKETEEKSKNKTTDSENNTDENDTDSENKSDKNDSPDPKNQKATRTQSPETTKEKKDSQKLDNGATKTNKKSKTNEYIEEFSNSESNEEPALTCEDLLDILETNLDTDETKNTSDDESKKRKQDSNDEEFTPKRKKVRFAEEKEIFTPDKAVLLEKVTENDQLLDEEQETNNDTDTET